MRKFRLGLAVVGALLALPASAQAAGDFFFQPQGIPGDSADQTFAGAIDVNSFSVGVAKPGLARAAVQDATIVKTVDSASPVIFRNVLAGTLVPTAKLTLRRVGDNQFVFLRYCFTDLRFTSSTTAGSETDSGPDERVTFTYRNVTARYTRQLPNGTQAAPVFTGWNFPANAQFTDPAC